MSDKEPFDLAKALNDCRESFRMGRRYIPDFRETRKALDVFEDGVLRKLVDVKAVYDRMREKSRAFALNGCEVELAVTAFYAGAGAGRPPLLTNGEIANRLTDQIVAGGRKASAAQYLSNFFSFYPDQLRGFADLAEGARRLFQAFQENYPVPAACRNVLFRHDAPAEIAGKLPEDQSVFEFFKEAKIGVSENARFCQKCWEKRFPVYREIMLDAARSRKGLSETFSGMTSFEKRALDLILADSCVSPSKGELKFRYPGASDDTVLEFVRAITEPYGMGAEVFADDSHFPTSMIGRLTSLFTKAFPKERSPWPQTQAYIQELLGFWKSGEGLTDAFDFADWLVEHLGGGKYSWKPRLHFWKTYWNAGRMQRTPVIYLKESDGPAWMKRSYESVIHRKIPLQVCAVSGTLSAHICIAFFIDDKAVAVDGDMNFAMRIGTLEEANQGLFYTKWPSSKDLMNWNSNRIRIIHRPGYWQTAANTEISYITRRRAPQGTGG